MAGLNLEEGVRRFSGRLVGLQRRSGSNAVPGADTGGIVTETDRLLGPAPVPANTRESFRAARAEAVTEATQEITHLRCIGSLIGATLLVFFLYIELRSILVLAQTKGTTCDGPLWGWLMVRVLLVWSTLLCARLQASARIAWVLLGYQWLSQIHTCARTSPELFGWIRFILLVDLIWISTLVSLHLLLFIGVVTFVFLVEQGYIANPRAARPDTLAHLERVEFDENTFAPGDDANDERPSRECCCCYEDFDNEKTIVVTPCKHYFHEACLGDWLKLARTCPLCRCDLDEAMHSKLP